MLALLTRHTREATDRAAPRPWRWLGQTVKLFDGSTVSMPDTPKNQAAYPQSRAQTPEMVRKEIWPHLLAYNLIRTVIAQVAATHGKHPRQISFTRAIRTLEAFRSQLAHASSRQLPSLYEHML